MPVGRPGVRLRHKYPTVIPWIAVTIGTTPIGMLIRRGLKTVKAYRQSNKNHSLIDDVSSPDKTEFASA